MVILQTEIRSVTVYPDRAAVTRVGKIELERGTQEVAVQDLPARLVPESLRVRGGGTANARLLDVAVQRVFLTEPRPSRAADLESQIESLEKRDRDLADRERDLQKYSSFLNSLATSAAEQLPRGLAFGHAELAMLSSFGSFLSSETSRNSELARRVADERREVARAIEQAKKELALIQSPKPLERCRADITLEVLEPGDLELEVTYVVPDARWEALYDLRIARDGKSAELSCQGQVTQRTGEDWKDVSITFSTAKPALTANPPQLSPWYVQPYMPPRPMRALAAAPSLPEAVMMARAEEAREGGPEVAERYELGIEQAAVEESGTVVSYAARHKGQIPSDGAPHKIAIAVLPLAPRIDYFSAPRVVSFAYRRAKLLNASSLLLLPGQANLFWDTDFIGTVPLSNIAPGQEFEVFLGVEERVVVERKLVLHEVDKRLLGNRRRIEYRYRITLRNHLSTPAEVVVLDQIPISRHEDIKVQLSHVSIAPAKEREMGMLEWNLSMEPNEEKNIEYGFWIEHPRDMQVVGLPSVEG